MKLLIVLLTVWLGIASAAEPQRNLTVDKLGATEKRVALVIGNAAYKSGPLVNPVNDARAMAKRLRSLGFDVVLRENLKQREIGGVYREFRSKIVPGGVALVFYAGHGVQFKGQNYFPATDADISSEEDVPLQSLNLGNLLDNMDEAKAGVSLVFLDACRDNPFARRFRSSTRGLAKVEAASGMLIHYATRPGSVASDGEGQNGTYTEALLAQMSEPGVPVEQMLKRVANQVVAKTKGKQEPWVEGSLRGDFYFIFQGPTTVQVQQTQADPEAETWAAAQGANTLAGYQTYVDAYPKGRYVHAAKIKLTDLQRAAAAQTEKKPVVAEPAPAPVPPIATQEYGEVQRPGKVFKDCTDCPEMVVIPAGSFEMGSPGSEASRYDSESPQRRVSVRSFAAGKLEITRGQFAAFVKDSGHNAGSKCRTFEDGKMGERSGRNWRNPGYSQADSHPVVCVSWDDAKAYVAWLSRKTGKSYRLLSEAEWEYAARAGTSTARYWGESPDQACGYANVGDQTTKSQVPGWIYDVHNCTDGHATTAPGGSFKPNAFGLYDMIGNAWEWTEDCWNKTYSGALSDGNAWTTGECSVGRVLRGGSWSSLPKFARVAHRNRDVTAAQGSGVGFRLARMLP